MHGTRRPPWRIQIRQRTEGAGCPALFLVSMCKLVRHLFHRFRARPAVNVASDSAAARNTSSRRALAEPPGAAGCTAGSPTSAPDKASVYVVVGGPRAFVSRMATGDRRRETGDGRQALIARRASANCRIRLRGSRPGREAGGGLSGSVAQWLPAAGANDVLQGRIAPERLSGEERNEEQAAPTLSTSSLPGCLPSPFPCCTACTACTRGRCTGVWMFTERERFQGQSK